MVDPSEAPDLDRRADRATQHRRDDQSRPEADPLVDLIGKVGAQHVNAGMGEVQHTHHAEDQRETARQHEQQHAVDETIQQRNERRPASGVSAAEQRGASPRDPDQGALPSWTPTKGSGPWNHSFWLVGREGPTGASRGHRRPPLSQPPMDRFQRASPFDGGPGSSREADRWASWWGPRAMPLRCWPLAMPCGYDAGRFILQVVGSVSSATVVLYSVFQPIPVFSTS